MAYIIDADVFIAAKNLHYRMDFCPAFWDWLVREHHTGKVCSIAKVGEELSAGQDELSRWADTLPDTFFVQPDAGDIPALQTVAAWVTAQPNYSPAAKNTFLQIADYYLIAQAARGGHVVVTHEKPERSVHRVKIPSVCLGIGVRYVSPYEMLRDEQARFVLGGIA